MRYSSIYTHLWVVREGDEVSHEVQQHLREREVGGDQRQTNGLRRPDARPRGDHEGLDAAHARLLPQGAADLRVPVSRHHEDAVRHALQKIAHRQRAARPDQHIKKNIQRTSREQSRSIQCELSGRP